MYITLRYNDKETIQSRRSNLLLLTPVPIELIVKFLKYINDVVFNPVFVWATDFFQRALSRSHNAPIPLKKKFSYSFEGPLIFFSKNPTDFFFFQWNNCR